MTTPINPETICYSCRQPSPTLKQGLACELCHCRLCKGCTRSLEKMSFSFLKTIPEELTHEIYCNLCYNNTVEPALTSYAEIMMRAKDVFIFERKIKSIPLIMKSKQKMSVIDCPDKQETMLRLAFFAAEQDFNAVVQVELIGTKVRINGYQTMSWSGTGFPARIRVSGLQQQS